MRTTAVQPRADGSTTTSSGATRPLGLSENLHLAWDTVSFAWDTRVLSFDLESQREFFTEIGLGGISGGAVLLRIGLIIGALLAVYGFWIFWRSRPESDGIKALYPGVLSAGRASWRRTFA